MSTEEFHFLKKDKIESGQCRAFIDKNFIIYLEKGLVGQVKVEKMTGLTPEEMIKGMKAGTFPQAFVRLLIFFHEDEINEYLKNRTIS